MKIPNYEAPAENPDPKAKKAPKGKGPTIDDLVPTFGRAWVSYEDL